MPYEACGVIHKHGRIIEYPNLSKCRTHAFEFDIDQDDKDIIAIWHTHPRGPEGPSDDDLPCMELAYRHGMKFSWLIVTPSSTQEYRVRAHNLESARVANL